MQFEINRHMPQKSSTELNVLEVFNKALPDFMSLYGVAAIVKESGLLPLLSLDTNSLTFEIYGDLSGYVIAESISSSKDSTGIIKESINIIIGQTLSKIKKSNINSLLGAPTEKIQLNLSNFETRFKTKYFIESDKIKENITLAFVLKKEV